MKCKILHIALENFAGLPYTIVKTERLMGYDSRLITLHSPFQRFEEDICLNLPFINNSLVNLFRKNYGSTSSLSNSRRESKGELHYWSYKSNFIKYIHNIRESIWKNVVSRNKEAINLICNADIIVFDGGEAFSKDASLVKESMKKDAKIVETFYGSDLRTRGIIRSIDEISDIRFTMEFDHIELYPGIIFLFFPFDSSGIKKNGKIFSSKQIRIGHSPTKRSTKGTDVILSVLESLKERYPIDIVLIEGLPHKEALEKKSQCDIFIDQIGELGYGISGLESLAMGIPTCVQLMPDFENYLGDHPFININKDNMEQKLINLIEMSSMEKKDISLHSIDWLKKTHSPTSTVKRMISSYKAFNWF